jgi:hypothetical protein
MRVKQLAEGFSLYIQWRLRPGSTIIIILFFIRLLPVSNDLAKVPFKQQKRRHTHFLEYDAHSVFWYTMVVSVPQKRE